MSNLSKLFKGSRMSGASLSMQQWRTGVLPSSKQRTRLIELLVFACLLPVGGLLLFAQNPTGLTSGFPWVLAGPVLFAARYGSSWGVACALVAGLFLHLPFQAYATLTTEHVNLALGMIVLSLIVGDAAASWRNRCRKSEAENQYLRHRLKQFSTDYHVLKVSHGLLEEYMAGQKLSLREALQQLKPVLSSSQHGIEAGQELMAVFSQFCSIQVAGLYAMPESEKLVTTPVAVHGDMVELSVFDPLLRSAIEQRELVSIKLESLAENHHENSLLAVVPLVDTKGHLHGVLAIKDMHFMAFQQQNLNLLSLLGHYVGNQLTRSRGESLSRSGWFLAELDMALQFAQANSTESALISIKFGTAEESGAAAQFVRDTIRSLDASWLLQSDDDSTILCLLLPLMSESQSNAFLQRVDTAIYEQFGKPFEAVLDSVRIRMIQRRDTRATCLAFLSEHAGVHALEVALGGNLAAQERSGAA